MKRTSAAPRPLLLLALVGLLGACQTPVGVRPGDPTKIERKLTADVITAGELSASTKNMLRWSALEEDYQSEPDSVIERLSAVALNGTRRGDRQIHRFFVWTAELSFDQGLRRRDPRYFLQAVVFAWAFLLPEDPSLGPSAIDPSTQLAVRLYNRGLVRAFSSRDIEELVPRAGVVELPRGSIDLAIDHASLRWGRRVLTSFAVASELEVRGMRNRYRWPGLGVALAASVEDAPDGPPPGDQMIESLKLPVCALVVFTDFWESVETRAFRAELQFHVGLDKERVELNGYSVPLAMEPTAAFAYMLAESAPWRRELKGFFQGDLGVGEGDGLASLQPYRPGHIPVVLVHGTASGPARWAELLNDLEADPEIRARFQFWLFTYNTGNPIAYSGWLLRRAIREAVDAVDPEDRDDALDRMIVMGHSQGGLLTKLTAIDSGAIFWDSISEVPIDELDLAPESREILEGSLFVRPVPEVERVVFMATPHRGSYLAAWGPAQLLGRFTKTPANLANAAADLVSQDAEAAAVREIDRVDGAIANMSPGNRFLQSLAEIPVAPGIEANSIVAVQGRGPLEERGDGVVAYESAHLEDAESELVIESGHSVQDHPKLSLEIRRILHHHIGETVAEESLIESVVDAP
jgi:pimeloyl-ACP methyl ester carboxylesterase